MRSGGAEPVFSSLMMLGVNGWGQSSKIGIKFWSAFSSTFYPVVQARGLELRITSLPLRSMLRADRGDEGHSMAG